MVCRQFQDYFHNESLPQTRMAVARLTTIPGLLTCDGSPRTRPHSCLNRMAMMVKDHGRPELDGSTQPGKIIYCHLLKESSNLPREAVERMTKQIHNALILNGTLLARRGTQNRPTEASRSDSPFTSRPGGFQTLKSWTSRARSLSCKVAPRSEKATATSLLASRN